MTMAASKPNHAQKDAISMEHTEFCTEVVERLTMGAGVIPVALAPDGEYHLLLGRERYQPSFRGSCRWSGFEGSRKEGETAVQTATREFAEESLGVVAEAFAPDEAWIRVVLNIENERNIERYHCTYLLPVAWDEDLPRRFLQRRLDIEGADQAVQEWRHSRPAALGVGCDVGSVTAASDGEGVAVKLRGGTPPPWPGKTDETGTWCGTIVGEAAQGVLEWQRQRSRTERALLEHPAVVARRDATWGLLQEVSISKDHLEKDMIGWWSAGRLRDVITSHGMCGNERFRPYFLPVLQTVLHELRADPPRCPGTCGACTAEPAATSESPRLPRPPGLAPPAAHAAPRPPRAPSPPGGDPVGEVA